MHMRFLSRGFKNLQWYGMTTKKDAFLASFFVGRPGSVSFITDLIPPALIERERQP